MSTDLCAQLAALAPVEVAGLVVDIALPFRALESLVLPLLDCAERPHRVRGQPVNAYSLYDPDAAIILLERRDNGSYPRDPCLA